MKAKVKKAPVKKRNSVKGDVAWLLSALAQTRRELAALEHEVGVLAAEKVQQVSEIETKVRHNHADCVNQIKILQGELNGVRGRHESGLRNLEVCLIERLESGRAKNAQVLDNILHGAIMAMRTDPEFVNRLANGAIARGPIPTAQEVKKRTTELLSNRIGELAEPIILSEIRALDVASYVKLIIAELTAKDYSANGVVHAESW